MSELVPPMPVFVSYMRKLGSDYIFDHFFDDNMNLTDEAPDDLRYEHEHLDDAPFSEWLSPSSDELRGVDSL